MKSLIILLTILFLVSYIGYPQTKVSNKGVFTDKKAGYFDEIQKEADKFNKTDSKKSKSFKMDYSGMDIPKSKEDFKFSWHSTPFNQGITGTCWSFSTTSFFESEINRIHNKKLKLSPIFTAYWEYVEKAKRYVKKRGNSEFGEGSEGNAVRRIWDTYGIVPEEIYSGKLPGQKVHDHTALFNEMNNYLISVKSSNSWNEEEVIATIKSILNNYLGTPPDKFKADGREYTPKSYFKDVVKLNMDDYVDIISLMQEPYNKKILYDVPDNWWLDSSYYNVPLDVYMEIFNKALRNGYTIAVGGDVSEPGYDPFAKCAVVPTFDIPSEFIDENARQLRFTNSTTTDDHGLHAVGYLDKNGTCWYLIKDSGSGAYNTGDKGYYFYHEDYVKLKIMDFMIHKDAAGDILNKF